MARIRTIKPEFPQSESMGNVSRDARLTFIMLWTLADDSGRLRGNSRMLASLLFPYDNDAPRLIDKWMSELEQEGCIARYSVDGAAYVEIAKWLSHQKIDKPTPSKLPAFNGQSRVLANPLESSPLDQGRDQGKDQGSEDQGGDEPPRKRSDPTECPADVDQTTWADWLALRKAKKAPVTQTVVDGAVQEAGKAGMPLEDFLKVWCRRGSQGLEAAWLRADEIKTINKHGKPLNAQEALEAANRAVGERFLAKRGIHAAQ